MVVLYWSLWAIYVSCIVVMAFEWKGWKNGFLEPDGTFTSKYYQILFYIMRAGFVFTLLGLAYAQYWVGAYSQIF